MADTDPALLDVVVGVPPGLIWLWLPDGLMQSVPLEPGY